MIELGGLNPRDAAEAAEDRVYKPWTFDNIAEDYKTYCELEAIAGTETEDRPGVIDPAWNVRTKTAIAIIREERYLVRREVKHRREKEAEAKRRAEGKNV